MRQSWIAVLILGLAACGEKKAEPEKTPLSNPQPSDPSPAARAGENPAGTPQPEVEAKKEPMNLREKAALRRKIKARIDKMVPPVDKKWQQSK